MAPRVTVKQLRDEARQRLLECGNGKTISRMNKRELLSFIACIHHPDAGRLAGDDLGDSMAGLFNESKKRKRRKRKSVPAHSDKEPDGYDPVQTEPDDVSGILLQRGRGLPDTYRAFVKAMLPRAQQQYGGPDAMRAVGRLWQQRKQQRGRGLTPAGAVYGSGLVMAGDGLSMAGMGVGSTIAGVAGGVSGALGMAGVATGATGVGLAATPFLEAGAAVAGTVAGAARGVDYLESLFA